jgi:hypothetical protein
VSGNRFAMRSISVFTSFHGFSEYCFDLYISQKEHSLKEHPSVTWKINDLASEGGLYSGAS